MLSTTKANAASANLIQAKKNLQAALGDEIKRYYQLLKSWFKQKMTREDFDHEARKLLTLDSVHLHNQFILALMAKCQSLGSTIGKASESPRVSSSSSSVSRSHVKPVAKVRPAKKPNAMPEQRSTKHFVEANPMLLAPHIPEQSVDSSSDGTLAFSSRIKLLPDLGMLHGRLIVGAWENALEEIQDHALEMLHYAVQIHLKNVLTAVLSRRSAYRLREKRFKFSLGADVASSTSRNSTLLHDYAQESEATSVTLRGSQIPSVKPTFSTAERNAMMMSSSDYTHPAPAKHKVTLLDLYKALQVHRSAIPCQAVYATNMERIVNRLSLPTHDELRHDDMHRQELKAKHELYAAQLASRMF